ncbi:aryl hydrocarbon receptor-like [Genypterus blacodes]|uniref:aryl hydrocarbon receptor-like n=1 Tax=Genypterus blacodes TaxID=154954 RepID=UPI003F767149
MSGNGVGYAVKKRKKPVQKNVKPPPVKTNPSKRHRDRLNGELDRLTSMLPFSEEVKGRLDKLSVLRLSVGYLKVKSYFHAAFQKNARSAPSSSADDRNGQPVCLDGVGFSEGEFLLQALNGFVLVVTADGSIFYASPTIQGLLGFHQSDVVHQSVYELIHMDDREMFKCQLHFALNPGETDSATRGGALQCSSKALRNTLSLQPQDIPPENSSFLERSFCCRLRCLLDNSSGFLALNFRGHLKYLHGQGSAAAQLALFAIATPLQPPAVMEIRTKTVIFQSKHTMDFAPVGIDTRGKLVLGYSETELISQGSGYQFVHAADMMYCADNHLKMIKTGESGFTFFRLLAKAGHWLWVQANSRVVFKAGRPEFIIARQKPLTNEEGEEHLGQRRKQLPFNLATGEGVLYELPQDASSKFGPPASTASDATEQALNPASLLGSLLKQDHSVYSQPQKPSPPLSCYTQFEDPPFEQSLQSLEQAFLDSHALLSVPGQLQASQKESSMGDLTSHAMIESLEQILGDIGDGGAEGFQVEDAELREWENTLLRMTKEREDTSEEVNYLLANDVFSYVEEALKRETGGYLKGSDQSESPISSLCGPLTGQLPESVMASNHGSYSPSSVSNDVQWQIIADVTSSLGGFGAQTLRGNVFGEVDILTGLKGASAFETDTHKEVHTRGATQQELASPPWPPSGSTYAYRNRMISTQPGHVGQSQSELPDQFCLPSLENNRNLQSSSHSVLEETMQHTFMLNHSGSAPMNKQPYAGSQLQNPPLQCKQALWQMQQQQPQSFHHYSHSSHTPACVNSTTQPFQPWPQTQPLSSSCMYEKRATCISKPDPVPSSPLQASTFSRGSTNIAGANATALFPLLPLQTALSNQGMAAAQGAAWLNQGMEQPCSANPQTAHTDMGNIILAQPSAGNSSL